ncbi:MAG: hypothetical protein KDI42_02195 [Gammaproteobacteria bacterium]|nr:hypothetical protein [Gammaproteobacteria bacterium]
MISTSRTPWDIHPDLTEDRLAIVARILAETRNEEVKRTVDPHAVAWGLGCMAFNRCKVAIERAEFMHGTWLRVLDHSNGLVFTIGEVPARFLKGDPDHPNPKALAVRHAEVRQMHFAEFDSPEVHLWRFLIDTDVNGRAIKVHFVGLSETGSTVSHWEWTYREAVVPITRSAKARGEALKLGRPAVKPKQGGKDDRSNEGGISA